MADEWKFEWLTSWDEVWDPAFLKRWKGWMEASENAHVFFHPALVRPWVETHRELREIEARFLVARLGSECTIFLPLVLDHSGWKYAWPRSLRPVGHTGFDYHSPVVCGAMPEHSMDSFWREFREHTARFLGKQFDEVVIPRVRGNHEVVPRLFAETNKAPFIDLTCFGSFAEFLSSRSKNLRQNIRRRIRQFKKLGPLTLRIFTKDELDAAQSGVGRFLMYHEARWPEAFRPDGFCERLVSSALPQGILHFSVLESKDSPISWYLGFVHDRRFYYYMSAFSGELAKYSPGKVHLALLIEDALERGLRLFDFLTGMERYKLRWTDSACPLYTWRQEAGGLLPAARRCWHTTLRPRVAAAKRRVSGVVS